MRFQPDDRFVLSTPYYVVLLGMLGILFLSLAKLLSSDGVGPGILVRRTL